MIKLLDAINLININNLELINKIQMLLEQRLDWLSDREPESSGLTYDLWSDKFNDLQEILDYIEELKEETDTRKQKELLLRGRLPPRQGYLEFQKEP